VLAHQARGIFGDDEQKVDIPLDGVAVDRLTPKQVADRAIGAEGFAAVNTEPPVDPFGLHGCLTETGRAFEAVHRRVGDGAEHDQAVLGDFFQQRVPVLAARPPYVPYDPEQTQMHIDGERCRAIASGQPLAFRPFQRGGAGILVVLAADVVILHC